MESDKAFRRHASHPHQTFQGFLVVPNTTVIGEDFYELVRYLVVVVRITAETAKLLSNRRVIRLSDTISLMD